MAMGTLPPASGLRSDIGDLLYTRAMQTWPLSESGLVFALRGPPPNSTVAAGSGSLSTGCADAWHQMTGDIIRNEGIINNTDFLVFTGTPLSRGMVSRSSQMSFPQLREGVPDHNKGALQCKAANDDGHAHVRPAQAGTEHPKRSQQYGQISQHVVSRTQPH
jgi:hypothetical protein